MVAKNREDRYKQGLYFMKKYHDKKNVPNVAYLRVEKMEKETENKDIDVMNVTMCDDEKTYKQLASEYNATEKTIQKRLDYAIFYPKCITPCSGYIIMDTTYFGSLGGVMLFRLRDPKKKKGKNLLRYWVVSETNDMYRKGIRTLQQHGVHILGIGMDGRRGLLGCFGTVPTQMCHFHQKAIIRRNVGKKPKLEAHKELADIAFMLGKLTEKVRVEWLLDRERRYNNWLKEKNQSGAYKHRKARSSLRSFKYHLKYLFTYKQHEGMPSTSNTGEGLFGRVKSKKAIHRGMTLERRKKFIDWYLNGT